MKRRYIIIVIFLSFFSFNKVVLGEELSICPKSEEYIKWLNLTPYEQSKTEMPPMCETVRSEPKSFYKARSYSYMMDRSSYPSSYDSRDDGGNNYVPEVRDQMNTGSCWTFAPITTIEVYMKKLLDIDTILSTRHPEYSTAKTFIDGKNPEGFNREVGDGGNSYMISGHFTKGSGPVLESDMPFLNNENQISLDELDHEQALDVNGYRLEFTKEYGCSTKMKELIKGHLSTYGAMVTHIFISGSSQYYNYNTAAYYYDDDNNNYETSNHAVTIIGWDDNYSKSNFSYLNRPDNNGAWIVRNSYGTEWGDNGYFYISYEDAHVCKSVDGVTDVEETIEDNNYYHDVLGYNSAYGTEVGSTLYAVNVFDVKNDVEVLREVTFETPSGTDYVVYVNTEDDSLNRGDYKEIASGTTTYSGYHTVYIDDSIIFDNEKFAVMVEYTNYTEQYIMGAQVYFETDSIFDKPSPARGISYSSTSGLIWDDMYDAYNSSVISIRAATDTLDYNMAFFENIPDYFLSEDEYMFIELNSYNIDAEAVEVEVYDEDNNIVELENYIFSEKTFSIVNRNSTMSEGTYRVKITYGDITIEKEIIITDKYDLEFDGELITEFNLGVSYDMNIPLLGVEYDDGDELVVSVIDSELNDVTELFGISGNIMNKNKSSIILTIPDTLEVGEYTVTITGRNEESISTVFNILYYVPVESISIDNKVENIILGDSIDLDISFNPSDATNTDLAFVSGNPFIISVNGDGLIKALKCGTSAIKVVSLDNELAYDTVTINVVDPSIMLSDGVITGENPMNTNDLFVGSKGEIKIPVIFNDIIDDVLYSVVNASDEVVDSFVVSEESGVISLIVPDDVNAGLYTLRVSSNGAMTEEYSFRIYEPILIEDILYKDYETYQGVEFSLDYEILPSNAYVKNLEFSSLNEEVLLVDYDEVEAIGIGSGGVLISDSYNDLVDYTININVGEELFKNISNPLTNNYLMNIKEKVNVNDFLDDLVINPTDVIRIFSGDKLVGSGYIGTGMVVEKTNKYGTYRYTLVVKGDVSGDGMILSNDALIIRRHAVKIQLITGAYLLAGDVNDDRLVASNDALKIRRHAVKIEYIK